MKRLFAGARGRARGHAALILSAVISVSVAGKAHADAELRSGGMDQHLFRPAVDSQGHITVNGAQVSPPHKGYSFGLVLDGGFGLLRYHGFDSDSATPIGDVDRESRLIRQAFTGTFQFGFGLFDRLAIGMTLPVVIMRGKAVQVPDPSGGNFYNDVTAPNEPRGLSFQGIGDLGLHLKVGLLMMGEEGVGLAAVLRTQFPTGDSASFAGEPGVGIWPTIVFEYRPIHKVRLSFEVGYRINTGKGTLFPYDGASSPTGTAATNPTIDDAGTLLEYDDLLTFGFGSSFRVAGNVDLILELYGTQLAKSFGDNGALSMEALAGLKIWLPSDSYLLLGGVAGIHNTDFQAADIRGTLGIVFEPGVKDRDGDGIRDNVDRCPDDPEDKDGFEDSDGCPDPDNDNDGILDVDDRCPLVPEDFDGDDDEDGCPEGKEGDRDGDGILDRVDKCPDVPEDFDGFQDEDGCPEADNDRDGIPDKTDLCPNDPEDKDGFEDQDGCPDLDNDGDRIVDADDRCPDQPETYNGFEDDDGCPDQGRVIVEDSRIVILEKIYFETDSAEILPRSFPLLDEVAATLEGNPHITLIEVQGHADERGSDKYNIRLTKARAESVVDALIDRGVLVQRLRSAGYGERCPIDKGHNEAAYEKNRRVEFKIIKTQDGPTGVEVACKRGRSLIPK